MTQSTPEIAVMTPIAFNFRMLSFRQTKDVRLMLEKIFTMSVSNKELIEKINEEVSKGNNKFYLNYISDDIRWNIVGLPTIYGKNNFLKALEMLELENFPPMIINNVIAEGDYVVVESIGKETYKTEKSYSPSYCDIYHFKDGKIQEMTTYVVDIS